MNQTEGVAWQERKRRVRKKPVEDHFDDCGRDLSGLFDDGKVPEDVANLVEREEPDVDDTARLDEFRSDAHLRP